jgi:excisionase family DNA binding protein
MTHNQESRNLQYAMEGRLRTLGWSDVEIIDDDLGRSAAGTSERLGFQKVVADVSLGHVGAVAAREVSRFARNSREWQQLVEICRIVDTVLIDHDAVYDARRGNDRLLLGLKGSLNEYELDLLRLRSDEAKKAKAERGELVHQPAAGYRWTSDGRLEKDPDRRVQETIELLFAKFSELGSIRQTMLWFREHGLELPVSRPGDGSQGVVWKRCRYAQFLRVLRNPVYAGFYAWGKTKTVADVREGKVRSRRRRCGPADWSVLIPDHHEPYVARADFDEIQKMIDTNGQRYAGTPGAPKVGRALLAGLLRCRRCGHRLQVNYGGRSHPRVWRYTCVRKYTDHGEPLCISLSGMNVDQAIAEEILEVVRPAAIEAALSAKEEDVYLQDGLLAALRTELEAARYEAERSRKQYDAVDPENRLVADELERRWNAALERVRDIQERLHREESARDRLPERDPRDLGALAEDLEQLWAAPDSDMRLKKRIVRTLIEEVIVDVNTEASTISLLVHWKGGLHTELVVAKRPYGPKDRTQPDVVEAIRVLARVANDDFISKTLSRGGLRTSRGLPWTRQRVASLRHLHGIPVFSAERKRSEGWMTSKEAAEVLDVSHRTLQRAVARGDVKAVQPVTNGPRIIHRDELAALAGATGLDRAPQSRPSGVDDTNSGQLNLKISNR